MLAGVYRQVGEIDQAFYTVQQALDAIAVYGERVWESEALRLKGELLQELGVPVAEVEEHFQKALEIAQHRQAKSLELRAAMSLSLLWCNQGKPEAARALLSGVFEWFTEGFDTPDLQDAKELLEALNSPS
ncbi:MAG: hypothetical protein JSV66_00130 [Trueperaceae bacterium]|nr:MAG: hypothetical protein JSV66_00130 [Trueperaceae bacterium]